MDLERLQSSDIPSIQLTNKRLEQLRALLARAKAFILRAPAPEQSSQDPDIPDFFSGHHLQVIPIEPPIYEPEALPLSLPRRRTKPARIFTESLEQSCPASDELMAIQGTTESVVVAERIRERFWTHVVRSLAAESAHGASPNQILLTRRYYMRSANKKLDASWWITNKDELT